ncbi:hypothetical protein BH09PAT2_BH09PAT2_04500 [soil metagenome]
MKITLLKNYYLSISITANIILITILILFAYRNLENDSLQFAPPFPLDNPEAIYTIDKEQENYIVRYEYGSTKGVWMVGKSDIELYPYLGKQVTIQSTFPKYISEYPRFMTTKQCIKNICKNLFEEKNAEAVTVNIHSVQKFPHE